MPYHSRESRDTAGLWLVHFLFESGEESYSITAYHNQLKADVAANFLNLLDTVDDDDTETLDDMNGWLGF